MGKFLRFLGIETRAETPSGVLPPSRNATTDVSVDRALTIPAVYRSFRILANAVSQLDLGVWRNGEEIDTPALVRRPDVDQSLSQFLKRTTISLAASGNAYWRVFRNADGTAASIQVLNPLGINIQRDENNNKLYHYSDPYERQPQTFTHRQVSHLRLLEVPGHVYGLGPIQACRASLTGALDLSDYADNWFSNSGIPAAVLSTDLHMTPQESDEYQRRWMEMQKDQSVAVLGKGLKFEPIILNPADAQFLESRQFSVTDIARIFGVPASYLLAEVNGSSMTYSNLEQVDTAFLRYELMGYLREIEDALSDLLVRGQTAKFKVDGLLRPDAKTLAEIHQLYHSIGVLSENEIRKEKGWTGPAPKKPKPVAAPPAPAPLEEDTNV